MKRVFRIILTGMLCCCLFSGCADAQEDTTGTVVPPENPTTASPQPDDGAAVPETAESPASRADGDVVDLTSLSSTMVYAEVYNMMMYPEDYIGKTIIAEGYYSTTYNPELDIYYHFVLIQDATECCAQGLEFIWSGEHVYPDDYPENDLAIRVSGVLKSYDENGTIYYYIATDEITVL